MPLPEALKNILRKARPADRFGFEPAFRFEEGYKEVSVRGFLGTCLLIAVIVAYIALTTTRFFTEDPAISLVDSPTSSILREFPPCGLTFRRTVNGRPLQHFYDSSYFRVHFSQEQVFAQDLYPRVTTPLGSSQCDFSSWAGWSGNQTACPTLKPKIGGRYQSPEYTFFVIHVAVCDPSSPFYDDDNNGTAVTCAPQSAIDQVLSDGRFNFVVNFPTLNGKGQFESNWFLYNALQRGVYEGIYRTLKVVTTANLFTSFSSSEEYLIRSAAERSMASAQFVTTREKGGGRIVLSIYARMDSVDMLETRRRETFLDLLGSWGALYGTIFAVLALYFSRVNEKRFYERFPGWNNVGGAPLPPAS